MLDLPRDIQDHVIKGSSYSKVGSSSWYVNALLSFYWRYNLGIGDAMVVICHMTSRDFMFGYPSQ